MSVQVSRDLEIDLSRVEALKRLALKWRPMDSGRLLEALGVHQVASRLIR